VSTAANAERAARTFGLNDARVVEAMGGATQNDNWLVEHRGRRLVLRCCRRNADVARHRWQRALERHLELAGFPVPAVLKAADGGLVADLDGTAWTLSAFSAGEHYDYARPEQATEAGRRLADFHAIAARFALAHSPDATTPLSALPGERYLGSRPELSLLRARFEGQGFDDDLDELTRWAEALDWSPAQYASLPGGLLHGDYHGRNLLFESDRLVALFDFDLVEPGPVVLDIARALPAFSRPTRGSYDIRIDVGVCFIKGYEAVRRLTRDERLALPTFAALWAAPIGVFYDLHPNDRLDPITAARSHFAHWRAVVGQRRTLEEVVARA
jgi:homoserine kinase type II